MAGQQPGLRRVLIEWSTVRTARIIHCRVRQLTVTHLVPAILPRNFRSSLPSNIRLPYFLIT